MLTALVPLICLLAQPSAQPSPFVHEPSPQALAAKAPGAPGYGLQVTTPTGKLLLTNLSFDLGSRKPFGHLFVVSGPAGWGPYRSGLETVLAYEAARPNPNDGTLHAAYYEDHYYLSGDPPKGSPADKAGLEDYRKSPFFRIEGVDGSAFDWDLPALVYHITTSPTIVLQTLKLPLFFNPSHRTYKLKNELLSAPADPADAALLPYHAKGPILEWLRDRKTWRDLVIERSRREAFAPLAIELAGKPVWVVLGRDQVDDGHPPKIRNLVEFWTKDPLTGEFVDGILDIWPEPEDGLKPGRAIRVSDHWYRLQGFARNAGTGRLATFELVPWQADVQTLLGGAGLGPELGRMAVPGLLESLEQTANDALLEWKTRTLPGLLRTQGPADLEDTVIRIEKGLLALDRQVRAIRQRLDALARAQAAQQAQAAKPGEAAAEGAVPAGHPVSDSEGLADVLEQRKAILQAVLGSVKQTLAAVRR